MNDDADSTDRRPGDYILFAAGFIGFLMAATGITVSSPGLTVTGAIVIFIALQALGWSGYQQPIDNIPQVQPASALTMIRLLVSPFGALMLAGVIVFAALFPLTREKYERIQKLLERRRVRLVEQKP